MNLINILFKYDNIYIYIYINNINILRKINIFKKIQINPLGFIHLFFETFLKLNTKGDSEGVAAT